MSLTELYSIETKFNEKKKEYILLMETIKYSCLGKEKTNEQCLKAARLNADMQSCLIQLSTLSVKYPPTTKPLRKHQRNLLKLSDQLQHDLEMLITDYQIKDDTHLNAQMYKQNAMAWGIAMIFIISLVIYQYKKI
jgi:hypothetical protein